MLKFIVLFCYAIIAAQLASGSAIPVAPERSGSELPAVRESVDSAVTEKVASAFSGFSPEQMSQLSGICFRALGLMLDQRPPVKPGRNSSEVIKTEEEVTPKNVIPQVFEKIGSRFFYIEKHRRMTWFVAEMTCRKMGGQLATIQDEEELNAINKVLPSESYWLDLNDLITNAAYVSWSSGKAAPYLKWYPNQVDDDIYKGDCVNLYQGFMFHEDCENKYPFICQAVEDK